MTNPDLYTIRVAAPSDLDAVLTLRREAEVWLVEHGIRQWTSDYDDYAQGVLTDWVGAGATWVVEDGGLVVGTVSVMAGPDLDFWGWMKKQDRGDALYLGKMIVARSHAGRGLGDAIMNWASRRAALAKVGWLRIDVRRDNLRLQQYYLDRRFVYRLTWHARGRVTESGWLAEREAGSVTSTPAELLELVDIAEASPAGCLGPATAEG